MKRIWLILACLLVSCSLSEGPRELPEPQFDARLPFPELEADESTSEAGGAASSYEERIARASGGDGEDQPEAVSQQLVPLAGRFVAEMPSNFDEWQWSGDARTTLISYREGGATRPSALIYAEEFSTLMRTSPSFEMNRFHRTVDPNLAQALIPPALTSIAADVAATKTDMPVDTLVSTVMRSISHTLGAGLNYRSTDDSFSGWKWVGTSEHDVDFRLGLTEGQWATRAEHDPSVQRTLDDAAARSGQFQSVADAYRQIQNRSSGDERRTRPAWMLVGSAATTAESGVHIAIICESQPACPVAEELSGLLSSLRAADASTLGRVGQPSAPSATEKARDLGVPYLPSDQLVSPGNLESLLRGLEARP
ncbi:MAG: hypothetical protein ACQEVA_19890 [Myxococcota bacterium]